MSASRCRNMSSSLTSAARTRTFLNGSWSISIGRKASVQQIRFLADDLFVERLEAEPAGHLRAHLRAGQARLLRIDLHGFPRGLGEELSLAAALEREEPVDGLVHRAADGEQRSEEHTSELQS